MRLRLWFWLGLALLTLGGAVYAQREFGGGRRGGGFGGFGGFNSSEARTVGEPTNYDTTTEWSFARLQYGSFGGYGRRGGRWATDWPKADRQFLIGVQRLTRLHARYLEEVISPSEERIFDWPWMYAVEVGSWGFSDEQAKRMRDYLQRGGFLMVDDFHGEAEWQVFEYGLRQIFPEAVIEEIALEDPINHVLYDIKERLQVPNRGVIWDGITWERFDGVQPHWRGIRDEKGRWIVVISHNVDLGDAWEWADDPRYPEQYASQAYRMGINYITYAMTH